MGIKGLSKLLQEKAPECIREQQMKSYFGLKVAIDASMTLYQFLIAVRQSGVDGVLTNDAGEVTSHLIGLFYRTIRMMSHGIKPVYVFDGKPPEFKNEELQKRKANREAAESEMKEASEAGDLERVAKMQRRLVKVSQQHCEEAQRLLDCLGVPWVQASGEAEAQCAAMAEAGLVYGTATEDMDALTFRTPKLIRHMTYSEARKVPIQEFDYAKMLEGLELSREQFVDLCILCGCDYTGSIRGIGPKKAFDLITKHKCIESILDILDTTKYIVPEPFQFKEARSLFENPDIVDCSTLGSRLKWKDPDRELTIAYLVDGKGFSKDRVEAGLKRLEASKSKSSQKRLDSFFKPAATVMSSTLKKRKDEARLKKNKVAGRKRPLSSVSSSGKGRKKAGRK